MLLPHCPLKHQGRMQKLLALEVNLKRGDWVCCRAGCGPQLNYSSKDACVRCSGRKEGGVAFDNALVLIRQAKRRLRASAHKAAPVTASEDDLELACVRCKTIFTFSMAQQRRFAAKGLAQPRQCAACRSARKRQ